MVVKLYNYFTGKNIIYSPVCRMENGYLLAEVQNNRGDWFLELARYGGARIATKICIPEGRGAVLQSLETNDQNCYRCQLLIEKRTGTWLKEIIIR